MHKPVDLSPLIEKKLSWQERAVQMIKRKKDLTEIESIDWSDKWRNTRDILNYLETGYYNSIYFRVLTYTHMSW